MSKIHTLIRNRHVRNQTHPSTLSSHYKKLEKEDTNKQIKEITTDLPQLVKKWENIGGGAGDVGGALYPWVLHP